MITNTGLLVGVSACHFNNSLLFQFILTEFMEAYEHIQTLELVCQNHPLPVDNESDICGEYEQKEMDSTFEKLIGPNRDFARLIVWNSRGGVLAKLKVYISIFLKHNFGEEKEMITMQHYIEKIYHSCQKATEILYEDPVPITSLTTAIDKATTAIHRLSKLITRLILHFREDENILFCVLRNQERFDRIYGRGYVAKQLIRIYPKGLQEAKSALCDKYKLRGFDNMLSIITSKIADCEASIT